MEPDRSPLGDGPYPTTGPLAVLARVGLFGSLLAIMVAVFLPRQLVPHFVRSYYLEHFAAFYVAGLFALAASPRTRLRSIAFWLLVFATLLELSHMLGGSALWPLWDNWVADVGGIAAAFAPVLVERFRRRFRWPPWSE